MDFVGAAFTALMEKLTEVGKKSNIYSHTNPILETSGLFITFNPLKNHKEIIYIHSIDEGI